MSRFLAESASELLLAFAGCGLLVAVGVWAISRCKHMVYNQAPNTNEMMSTFHELHEQGELSDEEYKNIKTRLAARMQNEARSTGPKE
jgi:uncharacterized membrane protein